MTTPPLAEAGASENPAVQDLVALRETYSRDGNDAAVAAVDAALNSLGYAVG